MRAKWLTAQVNKRSQPFLSPISGATILWPVAVQWDSSHCGNTGLVVGDHGKSAVLTLTTAPGCLPQPIFRGSTCSSDSVGLPCQPRSMSHTLKADVALSGRMTLAAVKARGTQSRKQGCGLHVHPSVQSCSLASGHRAQRDSSGPCIPYPGEEPPPNFHRTQPSLVSGISRVRLGNTEAPQKRPHAAAHTPVP